MDELIFCHDTCTFCILEPQKPPTRAERQLSVEYRNEHVSILQWWLNDDSHHLKSRDADANAQPVSALLKEKKISNRH